MPKEFENDLPNRIGDRVLGQVLSCRGSQARIGLPAPVPLGEQRASVGKFLAIKSGFSLVVGMISDVTTIDANLAQSSPYRAVAHVDLMGEIVRGENGAARFQRGVREYPAIGDAVELLRRYDLRTVYSAIEDQSISLGHLHLDNTIPAYVDVNNMLTKHFAILGSTGVGKSSGVAVIVNEIMRARPDVRVLMLDAHNEYGRSFGSDAKVIGADELKLPFWLFNFDEFTDVIYGGRPSVAEEVDILSEVIPIARSTYAGYKAGVERSTLARRSVKGPNYSVDTPAPYLIQDVLSLIDERMGRLENRSSRMTHNRLMLRIEAISNDPRYAFMFENANVGGDTMAATLSQLFHLDEGKGITILKLASLPGEVVDALVCVTTRIAFEFAMWSDGGMPLLLVCEEAHRYASADPNLGFAPARRSLARIAKEGRKYGVHLGLVTQRPAELDRTVLSQCSTLFVMRMAGEEDHKMVLSATSDSSANLLSFVPSLATGEVVGIGEGMPLAARFTFKNLPVAMIPKSEQGEAANVEGDSMDRAAIVSRAIERWRNATMGHARGESDLQSRSPVAETQNALARGLNALSGHESPAMGRPMGRGPSTASGG